MSLDKRKQAFITLGQFLSQFTTTEILKKEDIPFNDLFFEVFATQIKRAEEYNSWFTQNNVLFAFDSWAKTLTKKNIDQWLQEYNVPSTNHKTIAVIMAGNIPLVGFHDFLCVAITGNKVLAKLSSNDKHFIPLIAKYLEYIEPSFKGTFTFTEEKLQNYDAVIATGSNNTARYFDYYFGKHPHIIRKSRNSVAVLDGNETHEQLENLSDDIFRYYGLGCRNVSKIFVPRNYDFDKLFKAVYKHKDILNYTKYANNYDYNKAVYLMSLFDIKENGFLMLKEDKSYASPIASLFYEFYDDFDALKIKLKDESDKIQCITSELNIEDSVKFGQTQVPKLWNYADNVDTVNFLITL
ncbi:acyl-CoA reductase [Wenyingzhuangia sp. chi5]|uniref:Acyl-CoA reductase n=1 Tax=Wenyingzhuangia gilva TaxID=3057677 RepID=A0ABT8VSC7_9FLAO|nr:acyl-CoA reductase [Wenyingzhuangia sp. chi5]MDO3694874.1 acyl-CoA reductase [Wenyingzhuangia sp. chi5]